MIRIEWLDDLTGAKAAGTCANCGKTSDEAEMCRICLGDEQAPAAFCICAGCLDGLRDAIIRETGIKAGVRNRLTERNDIGRAYFPHCFDECGLQDTGAPQCYGCDFINLDVCERLAAYEDDDL